MLACFWSWFLAFPNLGELWHLLARPGLGLSDILGPIGLLVQDSKLARNWGKWNWNWLGLGGYRIRNLLELRRIGIGSDSGYVDSVTALAVEFKTDDTHLSLTCC